MNSDAEALSAARAVYEKTGSLLQATKAARNASGCRLGVREALEACKGAIVREGWVAPEDPKSDAAEALDMAVGAGLVDLVDRAVAELCSFGIDRRSVWAEIAYIASCNARGRQP